MQPADGDKCFFDGALRVPRRALCFGVRRGDSAEGSRQRGVEQIRTEAHLKAAAGAAGEAIKGAGSAAGDELRLGRANVKAELADSALAGLAAAELGGDAAREQMDALMDKGRDLLDSAISASMLDDHDLAQLSVSSIAGIMQNIPGVRSETSDIDGFSAITIRGLPLAAEGSKFLQLQEDGLPVLEFGDLFNVATDVYLRNDFTVNAIETISPTPETSVHTAPPSGPSTAR